jgi:hypothetical protein
MINDDLRDKYDKFLQENKETIRAFAPVLSKNQTKFCNVVLDIISNPTLKRNEIAERQKCTTRTVQRAAGVIRNMALPFRYTLWMDYKRIEHETKGRITARTVKSLMERKKKRERQ